MLQFYHPTKSVKGSGASFWYSDKNDSVFATIIKQSGWDEKNDNGVFKASMDDPNMKVNVKLGYIEVGGILDCIERNRPFTNHHDFDDKPKNISFVPTYDKTDSTKQIGYDFSITSSDKEDKSKNVSFFIRFKFNEARLIREYLIYLLHVHFSKSKQPTPVVVDYTKKQTEVEEAKSENSLDGI